MKPTTKQPLSYQMHLEKTLNCLKNLLMKKYAAEVHSGMVFNVSFSLISFI